MSLLQSYITTIEGIQYSETDQDDGKKFIQLYVNFPIPFNDDMVRAGAKGFRYMQGAAYGEDAIKLKDIAYKYVTSSTYVKIEGIWKKSKSGKNYFALASIVKG